MQSKSLKKKSVHYSTASVRTFQILTHKKTRLNIVNKPKSLFTFLSYDCLIREVGFGVRLLNLCDKLSKLAMRGID